MKVRKHEIKGVEFMHLRLIQLQELDYCDEAKICVAPSPDLEF